MKLKVPKNHYFTPFLVGLLISLYLIYVWYKDTVFLGGGEEGLSLWRVGRSLELSRHLWREYGTGFFHPFWLARVPTFWFLSLFTSQFSPTTIQKIFFGFLIFSAFFGTYLLVYKISKRNFYIALVAALFYVFNLYTQSQVFARFVYPGIVTWAYLPIFLLLVINLLEKRMILYYFFFWVSSVVYSFSFSHPSFVMLLMISAFIYLLVSLLAENQKIQLIKAIIIAFAGFIILNLWWIYPLVGVRSPRELVENTRGWEYDFSVLEGLSKDFTNRNLLLLRQKFYFERADYWGEFYSSNFSYLISAIALIITIFGLFKKGIINKKVHFTLLFITGWFLSKGVNKPFGYYFYKYLFEFFPQAGALRNSFEKTGSLFVLGYALFFSVGFIGLISSLGKKAKIVSAFLLVLICGVLVWPMWWGEVFSPYAKVNVPDEYAQLNEYLSNAGSRKMRVMSTPLIQGEGVRYYWEGGDYWGVDVNEFLIGAKVISGTVPVQESEALRQKLFDSMKNSVIDNSVLRDLGVGLIVLHKDIDASYSGAQDPREVERILDENSGIKLLKEYERLKLYYLENPEGLVSISSSCPNLPDYNYQVVSPSRYSIKIENANCPFTLVVKESFDELWNAVIDGIVVYSHSPFGYANSWDIDRNGSYTIDVSFNIWPWEKLF